MTPDEIVSDILRELLARHAAGEVSNLGTELRNFKKDAQEFLTRGA